MRRTPPFLASCLHYRSEYHIDLSWAEGRRPLKQEFSLYKLKLQSLYSPTSYLVIIMHPRPQARTFGVSSIKRQISLMECLRQNQTNLL
ncbi:hypothetical protein V2G26_007662 [Clonostachys chloroleuca]